MRMGLACLILRQFMAVRRLSIAIADGPMQHIKASDFGPDVAMVRRHYDERFIRIWEFYLAGCECFFRSQAGMVLKLQLGHDYTATPLGRCYIAKTEDSYRDILCKTNFFGNTPPSTK